MPSLRDDFNELLVRLHRGREIGYSSYRPIYYLVFAPPRLVEVKRDLPAWLARLRNDGWEPHCFSMASAITDLLAKVPPRLRRTWLEFDRSNPVEWQKTNQSLANYLNDGALLERLGEFLDRHAEQPNAVLLITDLEALHPYLRVGAIENHLYTRFRVPTVFLYPGERTGQTGLKFLGFYNEDKNYRSIHLGG